MTAINHDFDVESTSDSFEPQPAKRSWFDRMSIHAKIRGSVIGNTLLLALVSAITMGVNLYFVEVGKQNSHFFQAEMNLRKSSMALTSAEAAITEFKLTRQQEFFERGKQQLELASIALDGAVQRDSYLTPEAVIKLDEFEKRISESQATVGAIPNSQDRRASIEKAASELKKLHTDIEIYVGELEEYTMALDARLFSQISVATVAMAIFLVGGVLLSFLGARLIIQDVAGVVKKITNTMQRIAQGDTEAEIPGSHRSDEIGAMARSLAIFRDTTRREINRQREIDEERAKVRAEKDEALRRLAASFEETVGDVATSIGAASTQLQATASTMVSNAELAQQQTAESAAAMNDSSGGVAAAASASDEFALSIGEVSRQASASAELARGASQLASDANDAIGELSQDAVEIGEIVELIQAIAQRTNLLALNASIEAARSGEAGRGFAVVASEVKELAARTAEATDKVSAKISAIQNSTGTSVSALANIHKSIAELEHTAVSIAAAVDQQSVASQELARNIDSAAGGADAVSARLGKLNEVASETRTAASDVLASSQQLDGQALTLREQANQFLRMVRSTADIESSEAAA